MPTIVIGPAMIDFYATQPHYAAHLAPIYWQLPPEVRGCFYLAGAMEYADPEGFPVQNAIDNNAATGWALWRGLCTGHWPRRNKAWCHAAPILPGFDVSRMRSRSLESVDPRRPRILRTCRSVCRVDSSNPMKE